MYLLLALFAFMTQIKLLSYHEGYKWWEVLQYLQLGIDDVPPTIRLPSVEAPSVTLYTS